MGFRCGYGSSDTIFTAYKDLFMDKSCSNASYNSKRSVSQLDVFFEACLRLMHKKNASMKPQRQPLVTWLNKSYLGKESLSLSLTHTQRNNSQLLFFIPYWKNQLVDEPYIGYLEQENRDMFEPFIEDDVPFDDYCQSMEKDGTWAGHMELQAASLVTRSNICIHRVRPFNISVCWIYHLKQIFVLLKIFILCSALLFTFKVIVSKPGLLQVEMVFYCGSIRRRRTPKENGCTCSSF